MATAEEVETEVLTPMRSLYRVPHGIDDPAQSLVEYAKVLCRHSFDELTRAWSHLTTHHKRRDWPTIWDFKEAFRLTAPAEVSSASRTAGSYSEPSDRRTLEERKRVEALFDILSSNSGSFAETAQDPRYLKMLDEFQTMEARISHGNQQESPYDH